MSGEECGGSRIIFRKGQNQLLDALRTSIIANVIEKPRSWVVDGHAALLFCRETKQLIYGDVLDVAFAPKPKAPCCSDGRAYYFDCKVADTFHDWFVDPSNSDAMFPRNGQLF